MRLTILLALAVSCSNPSIRPDDRREQSQQGQSTSQGFKGGTRLKVRYYAGNDGSEQPIGFYDTVRRENCEFRLAADGVQRCLPDFTQRSAFSVSLKYFSDSACTQEVVEVASGCHVSYTSKSAGRAGACPYGERIFPIGARVSGQLYENDPMRTPRCAPAVPLGGVMQREYYLVGAEVPSSSFQSATEMVR